jgi:mRNA-degrading endonuclease RelE of RelBE toxin-antitoxin system
MFFSLSTKEGKNLDTKNVKYMTFDNIEYALFPILNDVETKKIVTLFPEDDKQVIVENALERTLFGTLFDTQNKPKLYKSSVAFRIRQWLKNAKIGESTVIMSPSDYAIRVACETRGVKAKIFKQKRGQYRVVFDAKKKYARQKGA